MVSRSLAGATRLTQVPVIPFTRACTSTLYCTCIYMYTVGVKKLCLYRTRTATVYVIFFSVPKCNSHASYYGENRRSSVPHAYRYRTVRSTIGWQLQARWRARALPTRQRRVKGHVRYVDLQALTLYVTVYFDKGHKPGMITRLLREEGLTVSQRGISKLRKVYVPRNGGRSPGERVRGTRPR